MRKCPGSPQSQTWPVQSFLQLRHSRILEGGERSAPVQEARDEISTRWTSVASILLILIHHRLNVMVDLRELEIVNCEGSCNISRNPDSERIDHDVSLVKSTKISQIFSDLVKSHSTSEREVESATVYMLTQPTL